MAQPTRWLWGLVPLGLLWGIGNLVLEEVIQQDVARRAVSAVTSVAGVAPGARPISARVSGRDVSISGEVMSTDGAGRALSSLRAEFGVRRASGELTQVVAQKPYGWSASREGDVVRLGGFVPDEATATANLAAARAALPGLRVEDSQSLAFGAPPGFAKMTASLLQSLPDIASGKLALDDDRFCVEGRATTPDAFLKLRQVLTQPGAAGFRPVDCTLTPPVVAPYRWSAARDADGGLRIEGFYPSDAVRERMLALLRQAFPGARIDDRTKPAGGEPAAFLLRMTRAVGDLARLRGGRAELDGDAYRLSGQGPENYDACQALRLLIAQTDGPDSVAQAAIDCPPEPPPLPAMPALPDIPPLFIPADPAVAPLPAPAGPAPSQAEAAATAASPDVSFSVPAVPDIPPPAFSAPAPAPPPLREVALRWSASLAEGGLSIAGFVRDEAARAALLQAARALFPAGSVEDRLAVEPRLMEAPDYDAATGFALNLLRRLGKGTVSLEGGVVAVSGEARSREEFAAVEALLRGGLPAGMSHRATPGALAIRPYDLTISADRSGVGLVGYLPDEATRAALLALVESSPLRGKLVDGAHIVPGAPPAFSDMSRMALTNLLRLDLGSATIGEAGVTLRGLTCRELIKSEVETAAAAGLPAGVKVDAVIGLRQTGCMIDPPNTCQNDLDALTRANTVLFAQGTTVVNLDATTERVIGEAFGILRQCPASRITIEGHANQDGDRSGFDNLDLSTRRALRVRDELVRRGLDPAQLSVRGFGSQRPLKPHDEPEARMLNRRVQFTVAK
jgi:outer membrane protein OmpA-like peptidoglycan-associated protein/osmotically-inducible protein OsmY